MASTSFFYHTHIVNGVTIIHSHPFDKKGHTHSKEGYLIINLIAHYVSDEFITPDFSLKPEYTFTRYIILPVPDRIVQGVTLHGSSRAPPMLCA
jgi:nitrate reductase gamma subunit